MITPKENIDIIGEVCFPNLRIETTKKVYVKMTNCSISDVIYECSFVYEVDIGEEASDTAETVKFPTT